MPKNDELPLADRLLAAMNNLAEVNAEMTEENAFNTELSTEERLLELEVTATDLLKEFADITNLVATVVVKMDQIAKWVAETNKEKG